jgi:choline dehydrogenase
MFVPSSLSPDNQTRSSARSAYYDPAIGRPNLDVATGQTARRLVLAAKDNFTRSPRAVVGVEVRSYILVPETGSCLHFLSKQRTQFAANNTANSRTVKCKKEVILAAGAIHSPVLLQLSGIGPADVLQDLGIPVNIDLPGVGNNFQDHPMASVPYNCKLRRPSQRGNHSTFAD